jgi:hypothetical protein
MFYSAYNIDISKDTGAHPFQSGVENYRYNDEIYEHKTYKDVAISTYTRLKRLMWAGHIVRMEDHRILKKILGSCFGGGKPMGRSRNRWEDAIQRDEPTCSRFGTGRL